MLKTKDITKIAILLSLFIICSKTTIQIFPVPFTLQTLAFFVSNKILSKKSLIIMVTIYLTLGLIGLPVFSTGGGFSYIFYPTFGFLVAFLICALCKRSENNYIEDLLFLFIIYFVGSLYMYFNLNQAKDTSIIYILQIAVIPFILKDLISILLSSVIYKRIKRFL